METKKNKKADLSLKSGLFMNIGLIISIALVLLAFEWKSYDNGDLLKLAEVSDNFENLIEVPPTTQPPPPPPKIQQPEITVVPDEEEIEDEVEVDLDIDFTDETEIEDAIFNEPEEEENAETVFTIVEHQPAFPGGIGAFYKFVQKKMKYPSQARRMGIEGKVFVQFVVDTDGSLTDIKVIRGIGVGCDEEAIRVLKMAPKWNAGRQRGVPVKVRMTLPITFKLS
ncbi:MAG: energy transducer TonB [Cyclobacteriaceae bacterium]|nr:energy transducer TonB [Cyclobacteriaceae bacterium]